MYPKIMRINIGKKYQKDGIYPHRRHDRSFPFLIAQYIVSHIEKAFLRFDHSRFAAQDERTDRKSATQF
jgi:hypothetical protein